ncbi:MAG TPA: GNAT family N-acetyltransferase [Candidatus Avipropionibacterium avicola]|uniref:GNAT family N-acetyltransferase n=1 Tax=Candidatus Avipropionibacterium avicola TaxID=2840701 RepID=A0A9D1GWQ3_9ACTN|nr:GNAT family N-acetyltransferase [Candidatus Avipropionibacterium avicola]
MIPADPVELPPGYPVEWEADVLLTDGRTAHLRPVRPDDADDLVRFYDRVSAESKYLRFFAPYPRLSASDVKRFTQVDYVDRVALVIRLADEMIAIGRYDRIAHDQAEVAFLVEDAHQGRGIAQLLLEHLAEAARERGITRFLAEVLPQNRRMVKVFADAGYHVHTDLEDGVVAIDFPILPTTTLVGVMERREHRAERASMRRLLTPASVVVLGPASRAQTLVRSLLSSGFRGRVVAVPTDGREVAGVTNAPTITQVEGEVDLVLAARPTTDLAEVVIDAAHRKAHGLVALTGAPVGPTDSHRLVSLARAYGLRAAGPDALGLINTDPQVALNASAAPMPRTGGAGVLCQSAAVGVGLLNSARDTGLGISSFVSTGDYADVTANDVMQFWEDDEATRVCMLSLDSIGNPRKFSRIIRRLASRKPVIVFAPGQAARESHAGDRGGLQKLPPEAIDSMFRQAGVVVVERRDKMFDLALMFSRQPLPKGRRIGLVTNSGPLRRQTEQTADKLGLEVIPIVLDPLADPNRIVETVTGQLDDDGCDAVLCATVDTFGSTNGEIRDRLLELDNRGKPLIAAFLDFDDTDLITEGPDEVGGLPAYHSVTDAVQAFAEVTRYAAWRERDSGAVPLWEHDEHSARRVVNKVLADTPQGRELTPVEARDLLRGFGIRVVPSHRVDTLEQALAKADDLGWNVVLKATAPGVRGRQDLAGVYRNLDDPDELREAWADLGGLLETLGLASGDNLSAAAPVIQAMVPVGVSIAIESREDASFGPMVQMGLEGLVSELLSDVVFAVPPLTTADARQMVRDLKAAPVLFGSYGGSPAVDVNALEELVHRVTQMADALPQLALLRLAPCIVSPSGINVVGARVVVAPTAEQRDSLARSLG